MFHQTAHVYLIYRNAVALKVVKDRRKPIYSEPHIFRGREKCVVAGKGSSREHVRRWQSKWLNEELSRYYRLAEDEGAWAVPSLLRKGRRESDYLTLWRFAHLCCFVVLDELSS